MGLVKIPCPLNDTPFTQEWVNWNQPGSVPIDPAIVLATDTGSLHAARWAPTHGMLQP